MKPSGLIKLFFVLSIISGSWSMTCYVCNSILHPDCEVINVRSLKYLKDTAEEIVNDGPLKEWIEDLNVTQIGVESKTRECNACRKIVTEVLGKLYLSAGDTETRKHLNNKRVQRMCGYRKEFDKFNNTCVLRAGDFTKQEMCTCRDDGCNNGDSFIPYLPIIVFGFISSLIHYAQSF